MILTSTQVKHANEHKFPTLQLFVLALCRIAEPIALTSIFPYAFPMVKGFLGEENPNNALYTGILISSFSLAEALTGMFWGSLSDRVGRKPVLLLGMFGTMLSLLMTGLAKSYTFALIARLLGGLLNGNMGVIQTMVGEIVKNPDHEPRAFAIMPFVWCIGSIVGPAIAGMTSNSSIFPSFPYLMPNIIGAAFLLFSIIVGCLFLQETLSIAEIEIEEEKPLLATFVPRYSCESERTESYGTFNWVNLEHGETASIDSNDIEPVLPALEKTERVFTRRVLILISALCLFCYHTMAYDHLLPIFLQDGRSGDTLVHNSNIFDVPGGVALSTADVGFVMAINGVIALLIQGLVFPLMTSYLGVWHTFVLVTILHPLAYVIVPYVAFLPEDLLFPGIYLCMIVRNLFNIPAYPLLIILIKEAANPNHLGKINGLAASAGAIARMLSPPIAGVLYGFGTRLGFTGVAWWGTGVVAVIGAIQLYWIKRQKNPHSTLSTPFTAEVEH